MNNLLLFWVLLMGITHTTRSQSIDSTFGNNGFANLHYCNYSFCVSTDMYSQQIYAAGDFANPMSSGRVLSRFWQNGTNDYAFGVAGHEVINGAFMSYDAIVPLPNGKSLAIGNIHPSMSSYQYFFVHRHKTNGDIDTSFNHTGEVSWQTYGYSEKHINSFVLNNGKIQVITGSSTGRIFRFNTDGSVDSTFGQAGIYTYIDKQIYNAQLIGNRLLLLSYNNWDTCRIEAFDVLTHQPDTSFAVNGKLLISRFFPTKMQLAPGGRIFVWNIDTITCYTEQGNIDSSFNGGIPLIMPFDEVYGVCGLNNGKVCLLGGESGSSSPKIARLHYDGTIDTSFGDQGVFTGELYWGAAVNGFEHPNNKLLVYTHQNTLHKLFRLNLEIDAVPIVQPEPLLSNKKAYLHPNPVTYGSSTLYYTLLLPSEVTLQLYSVSGGVVHNYCLQEPQKADNYEKDILFPAHLTAGVYILRLHSENLSFSVPVLIR